MNATGRNGIPKPPSWGEFLEVAARAVGAPQKSVVKECLRLIKEKDFLTAAEIIRNELGREKFVNVLKKCFHEPDFSPGKIHELLFLLDLRINVTPNVDNIYESAAGKYGAGTVTVKVYHDGDIADALRRHERVLIKSHGSISTPSRIIFTRSDYAEARNKHSDFYELIDALIRTHTFLFIGCGLDDPDIRSLLENYRYKHPQGQRHFFVTEEGKVSNHVKQILEDSMKIEILEYKKSPNHERLTAALEELVPIVDSNRNSIAQAQTW